MNGVVSGFSSAVPSAFWSIGAPLCCTNAGAAELTVIDQLTSVPELFLTLSVIVSR